MENISTNFSYLEATKSNTAIKHGFDNTPNADQLDSLKALADHVLEPLRHVSGDKPIHTECMYRSGKLQYSPIVKKMTSVNKLVGGDPESQHKCENRNAAGDFDNDGYKDRATNAELFMFAYNNTEVNYDKIISENIDDKGHVDWVHISYNRNRKQRRSSLVMFFCKKEGKKEIQKVYRVFSPEKGLIRKNYLLEGEY